MHTPTLDHTEPRQEGCSCTPHRYCPRCYQELERFRARAAIRQWLQAFGTLPDPRAPQRQG